MNYAPRILKLGRRENVSEDLSWQPGILDICLFVKTIYGISQVPTVFRYYVEFKYVNRK